MNIIELKSENVKRLKAVSIKPDGNLVVIGGKNGAGKTSVLDSIMYGLAGGKSLPAMPVRKGEDHAEIALDLGDLVVKRTFSATGGTALTVTNKAGLRYPSPQAILDGLVGKLSFDPLDFARSDPPTQAETLRGLVGLDVTQHEEEAKIAYDQRTAANRQVKQLEGQLAAMPPIVPDLPEVEVSTAAVLAEQEKASMTNSRNDRLRTQAKLAVQQYESAAQRVKDGEAELEQQRAVIVQLEKRLSGLVQTRSEASMAAEQARKAAEVAKDVDLAPFKTQLAQVERTNAQIRANKNRLAVEDSLASMKTTAKTFTAQIEAATAAKQKKILEAKYPIPGLSFNDAGSVTLGGIPFEQCSSAEQLRVSVAIGLALNPKLKVLLIRDGSLLDSDSLKLVADMASEAKAQVWLERVGSDGAVSVMIEDGMVSGAVKTEATNEPPKE